MPRVLYLAHDLNDPAVLRRVRMLSTGGADVVLAGFRRKGGPERAPPSDTTVIELGPTEDARLVRRIGSVARVLLSPGALPEAAARADVVMARNLEMLAVARRLVAGRSTPLVYECLDIHRLLLARGIKGQALRGLERRLLDRVDRLIVSSPAFLERYFAAVQGWDGPTSLVENKVQDRGLAPPPPPEPGPPWVIGWFGMIRCSRSLGVLSRVAAARPDLLRVLIAGRPSLDQFHDFERQVRESPGLEFIGSYGPEDLPGLYGRVHFTWAVDFFEEGLNSSWLLPNRLYEGQRFGSPVMALNDVETGRWLKRNEVGVLFDDLKTELPRFLEALTPETHARLRAAVSRLPESLTTAGDDEAVELVRAMGRKRPSG